MPPPSAPPSAPPSQARARKPITSIKPAPRRLCIQSSLPGFLDGIRRFQSHPEAKQLEHLTEISQTLRPPPTPADQKNNLPWVLKRMSLFQSLPTSDQLKYIRDLIAWRAAAFAPHPVTDGGHIGFLLPGLAQFVRSLRVGAYKESRDGNWFCWWKREVLKRRADEGAAPGDEAAADRLLLDHLLQYEKLMRVPVAERLADDSLVLPPISRILDPEHALGSRAKS
ncbi:hypothetical protein F5Y05DRAFT_424821 [Hypoxylon sp. FL0543]|nr:hypothetical protein F5Y05DRAFT_424821 [Hypoxylon sp. FL0543]